MTRGKAAAARPATEQEQRRERLEAMLPGLKADAMLVTALPNVRYLSGFTGSNGAVLLTGTRSILFTDPRYQAQAPVEADCEVRISKGPLLVDVMKAVKRARIGRLAFERGRLSFESYDYLKQEAKGIRLVPAQATVEHLRMVKSAVEIGTIKTAVELNSAALDRAMRNFRQGISEVDLAAEIEYGMRQLGADGQAFETIVASAERSALPHARPGSRPVQSDQLLLIDMGAVVAGYTSDMTRTFAVGRLTPKAKRLYRAVLESQLAAIDAVHAGVTCSSVDRAARNVLKKYGYDKLFIHSTGHGLGLEIHEGPRIGRKEATRLESGMTITIEPGAYVEGFGGVRIEDTVVVTDTGCQILTPTTKNLVVL